MNRDTSPVHILVLDDDEGTLVLTRKRLERLGYRVSVATTPGAARTMFESGQPQLLIIDYSLEHGESGLDFFRSLTAAGFLVPSILITGFSSEERIIEALRAGVADLLAKSQDYLEFLPSVIQRVLQTAKIKRQIALSEEAQKYHRQITDAIPHLVWTASLSGELEYVNRQWADYIGVEADALTRFNWIARFVHPDEHAATRSALAEGVTTHAQFDIVHRLLGRDGAYRWFKTRGVRMDKQADRASQWFATSTDIDDQHRAEAEREALLGRERIARLTAEKATRAKDEFVATLSHELRTPLNAIIGWTEVLVRAGDDPQRHKTGLEVILRNAKLQNRIVDDLLDMSSALTGRLRLDIQSVDLGDVIAQVLLTVQPAAEAKEIGIQRVIGSTHPIQGDAGRLQQVVWNLVMNAIKFTEKGGRITITLDQVGNEVVLSIADTGKGISKEFLPYVFDRFKQEVSGSARPQGGLGLGLAIVKQLVELHGGWVQAHSDGENCGATFSLSLPIPLLQAENMPRKHATRTGDAACPLAGISALVVEDDRDARLLVEEILKESGATVTAVSNGADALARFMASRPNIIISDIGMPDMDGYRFIEQLRAEERKMNVAPTPAAALTAMARSDDRRKALSAGFNAHVTKPVNAMELVVVIASLTGRAAMMRHAPDKRQ